MPKIIEMSERSIITILQKIIITIETFKIIHILTNIGILLTFSDNKNEER